MSLRSGILPLIIASAIWGCWSTGGKYALRGLPEPMIGYGAIGPGPASIEAAQAALLSGTESCFVVAPAALAARRLPAPRKIAGVLPATAGVAALGGGHADLRLTAGDLLVLLGDIFLFSEEDAQPSAPEVRMDRVDQ